MCNRVVDWPILLAFMHFNFLHNAREPFDAMFDSDKQIQLLYRVFSPFKDKKSFFYLVQVCSNVAEFANLLIYGYK